VNLSNEYEKMSSKWFQISYFVVVFIGCKAIFNTVAEDKSCLCTVESEFSKAFGQRPVDAVSGSQFMQQTGNLDFAERQAAALQEIFAGNVPESLRIPAILSLINDQGDTLLIPVTKDYMAIGSDEDFVRMPLSFPSAKAIGNQFNVFIPTPTLVDAIYDQASLQLKPQPMHPGEEMRSNAYYLRHNFLINEQAGIHRFPHLLVAGHKKDVVISIRLLRQHGKVPIYGWHLRSGDPIQPLSLVHGESYEDYSHGMRLIGSLGCLNGRPVGVEELFSDPTWEASLSAESGLNPKILLGSH